MTSGRSAIYRKDHAKCTYPRSAGNPLVVSLAYDGLCLFEFGVAYEVFGLPRPEMGDGWYRYAVASADAGDIRAPGGLRIAVDGGLEVLRQAGTIVVPGWRSADADVPANLIGALKDAHANGARLLSICSGVFVLAATGLLHGKKVTTHWRYTEALRDRHPELEVVPDVLYVDEGEILTSAGSAAGIDLCLHLVRRDHGTAAANSVARRLVVPPHRDGGQAQYSELSVPPPHEGSRLSPLIEELRANLQVPWTILDLSRRAGMSERTFLRRFRAATGTTPARWLLAERLRHARQLLEETTETVDRIADSCGFGTATNLRHHFGRELGITPTRYRKQFRGMAQS